MSAANKVKTENKVKTVPKKVVVKQIVQDPREVRALHTFCARGVKLCRAKGIKVLKIPPKWAAVAAAQGVKQIDGVTLAQ